VSDYPSGSFDYVGVCLSICGFWLHLCLITPVALLTLLVSVLRFTDSDYTCVWLPLWFFWLCWCLTFDIRILITLVSDYPSGSFDYVGVCPSIYGFWLHFCLITPLVLLAMLVSVLWFTDSFCSRVWLRLVCFVNRRTDTNIAKRAREVIRHKCNQNPQIEGQTPT
jgi:uncharacterized membrane protein